MRFEEVGPETFRRAVEIYVDVAWGESPRADQLVEPFRSATSREQALAPFRHEMAAGDMNKWTLRLGNARYPFMKLVFQELLIRDHFFFAVDTHDELDLKESCADYEEWLAIKRYNRDLKERIEAAWEADETVPTFANLIAEIEREAGEGAPAEEPEAAPLILVVDDDEGLCGGVASILVGRGYRVRCVNSGEEGLEAVRTEVPDLILSDLEMGGMTGLEFAQALRERPETRDVPFILATAASIGSSNFRVIDGFLVKPYEKTVLLRFVDQHLAPA